jgi:hypothetical protein
MKRFSTRQIDGTTSRTLLVVDNPEEVVVRAVAAGATESSSVGDEHGWHYERALRARRFHASSAVTFTARRVSWE